MVRFNIFGVTLLGGYAAVIMGQYDNYICQHEKINDGECDIENNVADCGYDGGDCCAYSCTNDRVYPCGIRGFNCADPDVTYNTGEHRDKIASLRTCSSDTPSTWLVKDTTSATYLAEAVNCSGGTFNVTWIGRVLVQYTLYIPYDTTLYVTGGDLGAEVNGDGKTRLFMAVGADLYIEGLTLRNGNATYGGAIAATHSNVFLNQTLCSGNNASSYGGAIHVGVNSNLVWEGQSMLTGNHASRGGGAVAVSLNSTASWSGRTDFSSNSAVGYGGYGGAVYVNENSRVRWDGVTSFSKNSAEMNGGALYSYEKSILSWGGVMKFVDNRAQYGGALFSFWDSIISWNGTTSFVMNKASRNGGALRVNSGSIVSWDGETSFANNTASNDGGALRVESSSVSWYGVTPFVDNVAERYGGGVYAYFDSNISWGGVTVFVQNMAGSGGAMYIYTDSSVSWDGNTTFISNTASSGGGLYVSSGSTAFWDGDTFFVDNKASWYGGALRVYSDSVASWNGVTKFIDNKANFDGGALHLHSESIVSCDGDTSFVNNTAGHGGGALYAYDSFLSWRGETSFTKNNAKFSGGAIYITTNSNISWGGDSYFIENGAAIDGGAVYLYGGYDDGFSSEFFVERNSTVIFQGNTCGGNGGALVFFGEVVILSPIIMTFLGNTAGVAGGAIYMSGVSFGVQFKNTRFVLNSAMIGGGLYSTGSGTAIAEDEDGSPVFNPTTLIGCEFIGNKAMKTGGAIDSGAGRDIIVNTSFTDNTASLGGALRLVGTTSIIGCDFIHNLSGEDERPGVSNDGIISSLSSCSFVDNAFNCQTGFFLYYNETRALFDTACKGCDIQCIGCNVEGKDPICRKGLEHSTSAGGNTTLESLLINRGYWRTKTTSVNILACYNDEACLGGVTGEQGYCGQGYEGPYCSVCGKGYVASLGFACNKCPENGSGVVALAFVMAIAFLFAFVIFLSYMLSGENENGNQNIVARVSRFIPLQSVKIVIVVWQILTQFSTVAKVVFPSVYQNFLDVVDILNFDLTRMLSAGCIIDIDFHDQLLLATLGPIVYIAILGGTYITALRRSCTSEDIHMMFRRKHVSMVLLMTFLIYSSISSTLFKTFACDNLDDGKSYLRADYRIDCDSSKHLAFKVYAGFMVVLYVVGIPSFYGVLLYNNREALTKNVGREENPIIKPITDLWKSYKPDRFYYEVIECVRRVLLTGALVSIYPNTAAQIAVALMMATFFIFVSEALAPYASTWDTWCSRTGHAIVFMSLFLALLLKVDVSGEHALSQKFFEIVLVAAHSCLILVVLVEAFTLVVSWGNEVKRDNEPWILPNLKALF